jgi:hypothetical protein
MSDKLYQACKAGYVLALQIPFDAKRARSQETLCLLRDAIAEYEQREPQAVQEEHEEIALLERVTRA